MNEARGGDVTSEELKGLVPPPPVPPNKGMQAKLMKSMDLSSPGKIKKFYAPPPPSDKILKLFLNDSHIICLEPETTLTNL